MSDEGFFRRVYARVRRIPRGRVATYGQVAVWLGVPHGARAVGWALRALDPRLQSRVPWHRVVASGGRISPRAGGGPEEQRRRLRAEGVHFRAGCVDMTRHGLPPLGAPRADRGARPGGVPKPAARPSRGGFSGPAPARRR